MGCTTPERKVGYNSPLIALTGTNFFTPGEDIFRKLGIKNPQIKDIIKGKMKSAQELEIIFGGKRREWEFFQLNHLVNRSPHLFRDGEGLNRLEKLCIIPTPLKRGISKVYEILTDLEGQNGPPL